MTKDSGTTVRWSGPFAILAVHVMALGLLFLLLVFLGAAFVDHYKVIGIASTPLFEIVTGVSMFLTKYAVIFFAVVLVDALAIAWIAMAGVRWLSAYSHTFMATISFAMFLAFSWMVNPMVGAPAAPTGVPANQAIAVAQ